MQKNHGQIKMLCLHNTMAKTEAELQNSFSSTSIMKLLKRKVIPEHPKLQQHDMLDGTVCANMSPVAVAAEAEGSPIMAMLGLPRPKLPTTQAIHSVGFMTMWSDHQFPLGSSRGVS